MEYFVDKIYLYGDRLVIVGDFVKYGGSCRYESGDGSTVLMLGLR